MKTKLIPLGLGLLFAAIVLLWCSTARAQCSNGSCGSGVAAFRFFRPGIGTVFAGQSNEIVTLPAFSVGIHVAVRPVRPLVLVPVGEVEPAVILRRGPLGFLRGRVVWLAKPTDPAKQQ